MPRAVPCCSEGPGYPSMVTFLMKGQPYSVTKACDLFFRFLFVLWVVVFLFCLFWFFPLSFEIKEWYQNTCILQFVNSWHAMPFCLWKEKMFEMGKTSINNNQVF